MDRVKTKTLTTSNVKARIGPLSDGVLRTGKPVHYLRGGRILEIREKPMIEPFEFAAVGDLPVGENAAQLERLAYVAMPADASR